MSHFLRSDATRLLIPYPIPLPRQHGVLSLDATGTPVSVRLHNDDRDMLRVEAKHLHMAPSALCRWCVVYAVQQLALVRTGHAPVVRP